MILFDRAYIYMDNYIPNGLGATLESTSLHMLRTRKYYPYALLVDNTKIGQWHG